MALHNIQDKLDRAIMKDAGKAFQPVAGHVLAWGAGAPTDGVEGYAPSCAFHDTANGILYENTGTKTSATWGKVGEAGVINGFTMDDSANIAFNTGTGTKIGTAVGQKMGFWNVTPVVQPAASAQADQGAMTGATMGDLVATQNSGWGANTEADFDKITTAVDELIADVTALDTLLTAIRTALVNAGIMKGGA